MDKNRPETPTHYIPKKLSHINRVYSRNRARGRKLTEIRKKMEGPRKKLLVSPGKTPGHRLPRTGLKNWRRKMQRKHHKKWNRRLGEADWRLLVSLMRSWAPVVEVSLGYTSKNCSRCGGLNKVLRSQRVFRCPYCGFKICRQLKRLHKHLPQG